MTYTFSARRALRPVGALAAAMVLASCSKDILNVATPDVLSASVLNSSLGATTMRNGAYQDFVVAFSGNIDGYLVSTENMGDAIKTVDTFADRYFTNERRQNENLRGAASTMYNNMHLARAGLTTSIIAWGKVKPATTAAKDSLAEMYAVRGYMEDFFAEAYCSGVPFSSVAADGSFVYGLPLTTTQMLTTASASFDTATTLSTGTNPKYLAAIGKARALLNQGQFSAAAAAVAAVPTTYKYTIFHSVATGRQQNGIYNAAFVNGSRYTVGTSEGTNGLAYLTTPADPRAPWLASTTRTGFDGTNRNLPIEQKYTGQNSPVILADGIEARLIEAEAKLQGATQADRDSVFARLNVLRATGLTAAITPLAASPTTQAAAVDMLFKERALWLWLTGHRLGDLRRLVRQYGRDAETVFPTGAVDVRVGNNYGTDVNMIVPVTEKNNPSFTGCLDRKA